MNHSPAENFATSLEGHFVTHQVGWIDYLIIAVSTISVLLSIYYTFKFLLPGSRNNHPPIMQQVLDGAREDEP